LSLIFIQTVCLFYIITAPFETTTSTSSTSTTTSTTSSTTTSTSTTRTTSTTTTTPAPPCLPTSLGSLGSLGTVGTIYSTTSDIGSSYKCFAYEWISPTTRLVTLAFQFQHDPDYWYLDDVSVYEGATQKLINGDFETGSLSPWIKTTPNGNCIEIINGLSSIWPRNGAYSFYDGTRGCADQISQNFTVSADRLYRISFWLKSGSSGSGYPVSAKVTLS